MEKIQLTPTSEANFPGFEKPLEVCNSQGKSVGFFVPSTPINAMKNFKSPLSQEEINRRMKSKGMSLQEFWQRMAQP